MNAIKDSFRALVRRRLWPVAVLLLGGLVAVPTLLAKSPTETPVAAVPHTSAADTATSYVQPADAAAVTDTATERRRVLGPAKDPFEPRQLPKTKKAKQATATKAQATATAAPTGSGSSSTTTSSPAPAATAIPTPTPTPAPTYPDYSIQIRFGQTDGSKTTKTVKRLDVLPSLATPLLVYRGVEDNGKTAIFDITGDVTALGDGKCLPSPDDCQVLKLQAGDTSFITVADTGSAADAQYELDLKQIHVKTTTTQAKLTKKSGDARSLLEADGTDDYAFDPKTGTLHKLSAKDASKLTASARRASL